MRLTELRGRRVALLGYGRETRSLIALLGRELPELEPVLFARAEELAADPPPVRAVPVAALPEAETLARFDVVFKAPGISPYQPELEQAARAGVRFSSATELWFSEHSGERVIAVTGSKGKSTTASLIAHLLRSLGRRVALAGNLGLPLTELWKPERSPDAWVFELSSFQTRAAGAVDVAVLTALFPEHLDWHGSVERYYADKLTLLDRGRAVVLNGSDSEIRARERWAGAVRYGVAPAWRPEGMGLALGDRSISIEGFALPGRHNRLNLCAALSVLSVLGEDPEAALPALSSFKPLPHRLRVLGEREGVLYVDDSIATTPQAALAALECFSERRVALILGGYERGLDWSDFVAALRGRRLAGAACQGMNAPRIAAALSAGLPDLPLMQARDLAEAVEWASARARPDGVVLLSPGAPSFPHYRDFAERGRHFARLAGFAIEDGEGGGTPLGIV
ncbi:MAG: UDP-N-acetylmuramoylalanine--D-glutamate ligase [Lysobacterales bacterium]|jgi:UDP-N-acetylmuramoylalanine--D-glutamate ligase|nr:MAG: UDP-N-acetylmuramoylalanine--D-glutamate ligase [Xanthomonadales bacterium]